MDGGGEGVGGERQLLGAFVVLLQELEVLYGPYAELLLESGVLGEGLGLVGVVTLLQPFGQLALLEF